MEKSRKWKRGKRVEKHRDETVIQLDLGSDLERWFLGENLASENEQT